MTKKGGPSKSHFHDPKRSKLTKTKKLVRAQNNYPKNRASPNTANAKISKLDMVHRTRPKKEKNYKKKSYDDLTQSIKKLESLSWDILDPAMVKVSPLGNPPFTPAAWWFVVCANYFKRKIYKLSPENLINFVIRHLNSIELRAKYKEYKSRNHETPKITVNPFNQVFSGNGRQPSDGVPVASVEQSWLALYKNRFLSEEEAQFA